MSIQQKKKLFHTYLPMGIFLFDTLEPVVESHEGLFDAFLTIGTLAIFVNIIGLIRVYDNFQDFSNYEEGTKAENVVWMIICLIGVIIALCYDNTFGWGWLILLACSVLYLFLPKHSKKRDGKGGLAKI